jgi:hypothetical protein
MSLRDAPRPRVAEYSSADASRLAAVLRVGRECRPLIPSTSAVDAHGSNGDVATSTHAQAESTVVAVFKNGLKISGDPPTLLKMSQDEIVKHMAKYNKRFEDLQELNLPRQILDQLEEHIANMVMNKLKELEEFVYAESRPPLYTQKLIEEFDTWISNREEKRQSIIDEINRMVYLLPKEPWKDLFQALQNLAIFMNDRREVVVPYPDSGSVNRVHRLSYGAKKNRQRSKEIYYEIHAKRLQVLKNEIEAVLEKHKDTPKISSLTPQILEYLEGLSLPRPPTST